MKKLFFPVLLLAMLTVISTGYANSSVSGKERGSSLMKQLVLNQHLLTNFSGVAYKKHGRAYVTDRTLKRETDLIARLRANAKILTTLNYTLTPYYVWDSGDTSYYGETMAFDIDLDVDNSGMIHETDSLYVPANVFPSGYYLSNTQIHVELQYSGDTGDLDLYPYVENFCPGLYGATTLSYNYPASGLASKRIDFDWGDGAVGNCSGDDTYQPARTILIYY